MITDALLGLLGWLVETLFSALPHFDAPAWLVSVSGAVGTVMAYASSMSVWWPITLTATVVGAVFAAWMAGFGIKAVRIVASFLTGGGGSAA